MMPSPKCWLINPPCAWITGSMYPEVPVDERERARWTQLRRRRRETPKVAEEKRHLALRLIAERHVEDVGPRKLLQKLVGHETLEGHREPRLPLQRST